MIERVAKILAERTVGPSFGIPGGGPSLALIDIMTAAGRPFITTHFEGSAALMAGAVGRLSGAPGLAMAIKGPGFANMAAGLATCRLEALPVVAAVEAYGHDVGPIKQHKRLGHAGIADDVAKAHVSLAASTDEITLACASAGEETPGPVILELAETSTGKMDTPKKPSTNQTEFFRLLTQAKTPVVIAGTLAIRYGVGAALESLDIPVFTTAAAKGVVDERRVNAAGIFTGAGADLAPETQLMPGADLVVGIGLRAQELLSLDAITCQIISVEAVSPAAPNRYAALVSPGELTETFAALAGKSWGLDELVTAKANLANALLGAPFLPAHCFSALGARFGTGYRLVLDTGHFCTIGEHMTPVAAPDRYLSSAMGRSMGAALPLAIGGALHDAEIPTVLAIGDGGIGMFFSELRIAVAHRLPILVLFMRDGAFGSIRSAAKARGLNEAPLIIGQPSWRGAAEGIGLQSTAADDEQSFVDALREWRPADGPGLIEVGFPADPYRDMTSTLRS